ncbi:MAG: helix-turn-helix domain-containing protein [Bacteroidales bacterium]|nr:helix-turn-helix domain-containing protein [Bacteroidales bacterium]
MIPGTGNEKELLERLTQITLENLENENFGGTELAMHAGMSISTLNRRLHKITSKPTSQFIREIRLKKAKELLMQQTDTAAEVAWKVGFGSPAYFSKCFHDFYGFPPGEVKKRMEEGIPFELKSEPELLPDNEKTIKVIRERVFSKKMLLQSVAVIIVISLVWLLYNFLIKANYIQNTSSRESQELSIVVLPFKNFSDDPKNQYFADGLMEDILNNLFRITALRVVSRTTADQFRETNLSTREIAKELKVNYVLEGSVRRYEDKARITVQLIDAWSDEHLWSSSFDRELTDIMGIQSDVALRVAQELNMVLSESEIKQIEKISTNSPEAYDYYLRARFLLHKANSFHRADFDRTGVLNCIPYYEKAIAADSTFAEAYAGLANAWFNLSAWGFLPSYEGFTKAGIYSKKALEYDPYSAEAHAVTGALFIWGGGRNIEEGSKELKMAVDLNPHFPTAHQWYAQSLMITGPIEEARFHVNRALELEPYFWVVQNLSAWIYYFEEEYEKAIETSKIARDLNPGFSSNSWLFVLNYAKLGEGDKMLKELQVIIKRYTQDETYLDEIQIAYNENGIDGIFIWLDDVNQNKPIPVEGMDGHPFFSAWWNAILGNKNEAVFWLERTLEDPRPLGHYSNLITTNPDFDLLRDDPRFLVILEKFGLTPYHKRKVI